MSRNYKLKSTPPSQPPLLQRIWRNSQTKLLAYGQAVSGAVLLTASQTNSLIHDSFVQDALGKMTLPAWFPWTLLGLAALTYVAHGHNDA